MPANIETHENCFSACMYEYNLSPNLTVYKRIVIKRTKSRLEMSAISHISFLLCASKYAKLNIQQNHLRISSRK